MNNKIGDKVWMATCFEGEWFASDKESGYICNIEVRYPEMYINYIIDYGNNIVQRWDAKLCFDSFEQCELWCNTMNREVI